MFHWQDQAQVWSNKYQYVETWRVSWVLQSFPWIIHWTLKTRKDLCMFMFLCSQSGGNLRLMLVEGGSVKTQQMLKRTALHITVLL